MLTIMHYFSGKIISCVVDKILRWFLFCCTQKSQIYTFYVDHIACYDVYIDVGVSNLANDDSFHGPDDLTTSFPNLYTLI